MMATRKHDTPKVSLLLPFFLLRLSRFNVKSTTRNRNKRILLRKNETYCEKYYYEDDSKGTLLSFNLRAKCQLLKVPTVPQYQVKLTTIFVNKSLSSQQTNHQKQLQRPKNGVNERRSEYKTTKAAQTFDNLVSTNQNTETRYREKYQNRPYVYTVESL